MMSIFEYNKLCLGLHLQLSRDLTNTSSLNFYRPSALPDAQPTVTEHWRHNIQLKYKWYINSSPSFDVFLFFDWHFMCVYSEMNTFFSTWIFSSVLSDYIFWNNTRSCEIEISQSTTDMELGHWVTGSTGHLGHLSRPGHRVIILTRCETRVFPVFKKAHDKDIKICVCVCVRACVPACVRVKIRPTVIEILTFNKWSSKFYFPEACKRQTAIKTAKPLAHCKRLSAT